MAEPVSLACPISCLDLSRHAAGPLVRTLGLGSESAVTMGDVLRLARRAQLGDITGLGPVRVAEIEDALTAAGFRIHHGHRCRGSHDEG